ncbi:MAG: amidase, hydantoinase/carbamoylase family, partial [Halonotius sp. J07HN6]
MNASFRVDGERLRRDIEQNAQFGMVATDEGQARTVLPGTEPNRGARQHFVDRMIQAGLTVDVDAVGNIYGTYEPRESTPGAAAVAVGSHLDSVPYGGIFDGPLGVYAGLEAVRTLRDAKLSLSRPIQVVCFTGEEGTRFADGVLGSSVAAGELPVEEALSMTDGETTLQEALIDIGFNGEGQLNASEWEAWFELHVEQSTKLEELGLPAGVVTTITGTTRLHVTIEGDADHTGTTSMTSRTDALAAASEFILTVERAAQEAPETAVATVGELSVDPGNINVVPGSIELSVDIRDIDKEVIEELIAKFCGTLTEIEATRGVETSVACSY